MSFFSMSTETLNKIKEYNRPVRVIIWIVCIVSTLFIIILAKAGKTVIDPLAEIIILGMFTDMGVTGLARSYEKVTQAKLNSTQAVVDTVANSDNITASADIKIPNGQSE